MSQNQENPEKRILTINPELFKVQSNTTRKNRPTPKTGEIKVKNQIKSREHSSTLKKNLLNYIRKQQDNRAKMLFKNEKQPKTSINVKENIEDYKSNDFQDSVEYFNNLSKAKERKQLIEKNQNKTLKYQNIFPDVQESTFLQKNDITQKINQQKCDNGTIHWKHYPPPQYGCLKGGNLPTYRSWIAHTQKNRPAINVVPNFNNIYNNQTTKSNLTPMNNTLQNTNETTRTNLYEVKMQEKLKEIQDRVSKMKNKISGGQNISTNDNINAIHNIDKIQRDNIAMAQINQMPELLKKPKRMINKKKKTIRRTYNVGKSKRVPKISVLVSNKTIRKNILTKSYQIQQVPIQEVKRYLIKKGFIRVGSIAPNDVLRKMYESALLICGEMQNHNPKNLLYNFLHDENKEQ